MIFILRDLRSKTIITISNESFNIVREFESLINAINNFVFFHCFEMLYIEKTINENEYIKI